jgi:hypothetical protein
MMILKSYRNFILPLIFTLLCASPALTAQIDGVTFADEYRAGDVKLAIRGYAILNYMLVIRAYAGALYLTPATPSSQALSDTPRVLELHYFHSISAEDFRTSTTEMIRRNTTPEAFNGIRREIDVMNALYRNVSPGDRYRAEYIPGKGTTLYLKGKALGTVRGELFSKAFFSIWIGSNPIDRSFRDRLLGIR